MHNPVSELTEAEQHDLRRLAGFMIPSSIEYGVPGADDPRIFADIVRSLGRDRAEVRKVLALLRSSAGGSFSDLDASRAETVATALLSRTGPEMVALGRAVLQCYYRDDRVFRSLGREPRAPFPKGHEIAATDWSLLDGVRRRPRMWRDVDASTITEAKSR